MIILCDLNYILISNSRDPREFSSSELVTEEYKPQIVEILKGFQSVETNGVYLATFRWERHEQATLENIEKKTGFIFDGAYFNPEPFQRAHEFKASVADSILSRGTKPEHIIAIESNGKSIKEYLKRGIFCLTNGK